MKQHTLVFRLHLYVGLTVGLLLVSAGLTGSVLVFREEIDALLHPELLHVAPAARRLPLQQIVDGVARAYPDAAPARLRMPRAPGETYAVTLRGAEQRLVFVDPYRGTILGSHPPTETFTGWLFAWHSTLLAGETGKTVMGLVALCLAVLVATGAVVWWPGVRQLARGFRVSWRANWKRVNWDLHRVGGAWSLLFLASVSITGASLVFHVAFMAGLDRVTLSTPRPPVPKASSPAGGPARSLDPLLRRAERALPGGIVTHLTLPADPGAALMVRKRFRGELHPNGRSFIYLDPRSGEILSTEHALHASRGARAYNILYPIHIGRWGGLIPRVAYAFLGLTPLLLFVSGCLMWWNRTQAVKHRPRRPPAKRTRSGISQAPRVFTAPDDGA